MERTGIEPDVNAVFKPLTGLMRAFVRASPIKKDPAGAMSSEAFQKGVNYEKALGVLLSVRKKVPSMSAVRLCRQDPAGTPSGKQ